MNDEPLQNSAREADLVRLRIAELHENPLQGNFDLAHLRAIHAYLFQDLPEHRPGIIRERTAEAWVKHRAHEGQAVVYDVPYAKDNIEKKLIAALSAFGGSAAIRGQSPELIADRLAGLYGDLDYAHGFYEGNSRTLREFMRTLAAAADYRLDWHQLDVGARERNELYTARDLAVLERAFPDLTPERAMQTTDRAEYEASFVLAGLRRVAGTRTLAAIIRTGLSQLPNRMIA